MKLVIRRANISSLSLLKKWGKALRNTGIRLSEGISDEKFENVLNVEFEVCFLE
jgi:hypothetical protein